MTTFNEEEFVELAKTDVKKAVQQWVNYIWDDENDEDVEFSVSSIENEYCKTLGSISLELVDSEGGREGQGEYVDRTFAFSQNGEQFSHFVIFGTYSSWEGIEWDEDITRMYPHRVMTTVWKDTPQENPPKG